MPGCPQGCLLSPEMAVQGALPHPMHAWLSSSARLCATHFYSQQSHRELGALPWGWLPMSSVCSLGDMGRALVSDACGVSELLESLWLPEELKLRRLEQRAVSLCIAAGDACG